MDQKNPVWVNVVAFIIAVPILLFVVSFVCIMGYKAIAWAINL